MRTPYVNVTNTRADAAVVGIRRGAAIVLRCFLCDWGMTVGRAQGEGPLSHRDNAASAGRDHAYDHPEVSS